MVDLRRPASRLGKGALRVLYSFPHKLGADRICYTAWQQVNGLAAAGASVVVFPGAVARETPAGVTVKPTLARGRLRLPYRLLGTIRACALHDHIVARRLERMAGQIDIVHTWPLGALRTLKTARRLGIPTVLERPNAHTRFAYEVVRDECRRLGVELPRGHEHAYNEEVLRIEEEEYELADALLCPSNFVVRTFVEKGVPREKLVRHIYGFDEKRFYPADRPRSNCNGLTMLSVGVCAVRKGLHFALEAWLKSPASRNGKFLIAGGFVPSYQQRLAPMLAHPSVQVLGHRTDVADLMRQSDILVLPSIEEGFGLVCTEAMGSGCVPLVSEACTDICRHMENALVHKIGDVAELQRHITLLFENRHLLARLRAACLASRLDITWTAAGAVLLEAYRSLGNQPLATESASAQSVPS
jgi:glycosyltransferase involved in cell wall biosynthesis